MRREATKDYGEGMKDKTMIVKRAREFGLIFILFLLFNVQMWIDEPLQRHCNS